jgi:general secretion pathway protein B
MSYILDALRKADAERERDPARGIHAQPAAGLPLRAARHPRAWVWPVAAGGVALAVAYGFWGRAPEPVAIATKPMAVPIPTAMTMAPAPAPVVMPVATSVTPPAPAAVAHMAARAVVAPRAPAAQAAAPVASAAAAPVTDAAPAATAAAPAPLATAATPAPAATDRILALTELPADVQRSLPKLAISGGVHSDNAAQRMLIVGGQVMTEGQELAPGVLLEQIRARSAVLRYRNYRYSVAY